MFRVGLLVEKVLASKGLELAPKIERRRLGNLSHDEIIKTLLPGAEITVLDVGANIGQSVERFRDLFQERLEKIISFEPVPSAFAKLEEMWGGRRRSRSRKFGRVERKRQNSDSRIRRITIVLRSAAEFSEFMGFRKGRKNRS